MLRNSLRKLAAGVAGTALLMGTSGASAPLSSCTLSAYSNTGWTANTTITASYPLVTIQADVVYVGPSGVTFGSGGSVAPHNGNNLVTFQAAGGNHFFMPLNGASWGFVAASCVEGLTIRYDAI